MNQDVKYDFKTDLTGIGDRSEYEKITLHPVAVCVCVYDLDLG